MQKPRALLFFIAALVWLAVPVIAAAQGTIVPCDGISCDLCSIGQLMQNIVNFLIFFSLFIAVLMFAYAGFVYATSSGNPIRINDAHKLFKDVLIGFLIAISAWLVVQTIISVIFDGDAFVGTNWYQLECSDPSKRLMNTNIGNLFDTVIPDVNAPAGGGTGTGTVDTGGTPTGVTTPGSVANMPLVDTGGKCVGDCVGLPLTTSSGGCTKDSNGYCVVTRATASKLVNSCNTLGSTGVGCTVTSAIGSGHTNACHTPGSAQAGTCIDLVVSCNMTSASCVKQVVNATGSSGCNAVFESQSQATIDALTTADPSLAGHVDQVSWATGNHFSVYCN